MCFKDARLEETIVPVFLGFLRQAPLTPLPDTCLSFCLTDAEQGSSGTFFICAFCEILLMLRKVSSSTVSLKSQEPFSTYATQNHQKDESFIP